jgi:Zn-dependent protease with chaperone function
MVCGIARGQRETPSTETPRIQTARRISLPVASPAVRDYNATWYTLYFVGAAWEVAGLWLLLRFRAGPRLRDYLERRTSNRFFQAVLFYAVYSLLLAVWHLPLAFVGYSVDRQYGFARQSLGLWITDRGRGYLLGLPTALVVWFAYWLVRASPKRWWAWLAAGAIPWITAQYTLWPVLGATMYNRFTPMPDSPLKQRLVQLAEKAGVGGAEVLIVDISRRTTKLNAYVAGLGPTKRIVIWDTTLKALSDDEVVAITGHELGHYVLHHVWLNVATGSLGALLILWALSRGIPWAIQRWGVQLGIRGIDDIGGLPLVSLCLFVILFLQTPIASAISRYHEHEADRYGLELTGLNEATASAFVSFVDRDLADPDPPRFLVFWFYSHPPLKERVEYALGYGR